jgi:hypothetical protein
MAFDLTKSCILYMENPQMAVQQVASHYQISVQEAASILKRKCANMLPDSEYSNWFGSKVAKERRMDVSKGKALAKHSGVRRMTDCGELEEAMQDINSELDYESTKLVGAKKGATRVGTRAIQGLNRVYKIAEDRYRDMECSEEAAEIRAAEEEQMLSDVFTNAEQSRLGIKKGTNLTTYIAIGVGVLILGAGIMLAIKKAKKK